MTDATYQDTLSDDLSYFKDIVLKDVRNESTEEDRQYLMTSLEYWLYFLQITRRDVEFQLSSHKSKEKLALKELKASNSSDAILIEEIKKLDKWKMGAVRFLAAIEKRMLYVKILLKDTKIAYDTKRNKH